MCSSSSKCQLGYVLCFFNCDHSYLLFVLFSDLGGSGEGGEDLFTLEAEISELQRENARVESQMLRLKTDINAMEAHLRHGEKVGSF